VQSLNPLEKLLYFLATFVLGRRHARTFFILYLVALHVFVAFTLWEATLSSEGLRHSDQTLTRPP
jgi:hypothetical protein